MSPSLFRNPVLPGFHPDPSICRVGDRFYLVTSSFEYFPGIPIFESVDLVHWEHIGHCLTRESQLDLSRAGSSQGIFAPTIRYHDGHFFVTATNVSSRGHFIVHTADPRSEWSDPVWVDQNGIDPSLFFEGGVAYFQSNVEPDPSGPHFAEPDFQRGIQQCIVDPFTGERLSPSTFLWSGSGGRFPEAPHLFHVGDYYYLIIAEGGTENEHMVTVARAASPWGPFEPCPRNPILSHRSSASPIRAVGHADLVELPNGEWWAVMLGTRPVNGRHHLGRETFLAPVTWSDGWPTIGEEGRVPELGIAPLPLAPTVPEPPRDDFNAERLGPQWSSLRRPLPSRLSLRERPGWLRLRGSAAVSHPDLTFIGRRQQHFVMRAETALEAERGLTEAGIMIRMDERHHYEVFVTDLLEQRSVVLRRQVGDLIHEERRPAPSGPVVLRVESTPEHYQFSFRGDAMDWSRFPAAEVRYVTTEVAGGFTGVFVGLYSVGDSVPADFDWFEYAASDMTRAPS